MVPSAFCGHRARPAQTYSLVLLGGLDDLTGYFGVDLPRGQLAESMAPPTMSRNAPAQAMNMADPNSYLRRGVKTAQVEDKATSTEL